MTYRLIIQFLCLSSLLSAQTIPDSIFSRKDLLLAKAQLEVLTQAEQKELVSIAFTLQNKGFLLDEQDGDFENALVYMDYTIPIWQTLDNVSMEANLHKFKGQLFGKLYRFVEAKQSIQYAILLYQTKNQLSGIAVTYYDLAIVYNFEEKTDSSRYYIHLASDFWENTSDTSRMIGLYLYDVYLDLREQKTNAAKEKITLFESKYPVSKIRDWDQMTFHYLNYLYANSIGDFKLKSFYFETYKELSDRLKADLSKQFILN